MTNLWITVGLPGSGKSHFVNNEFYELMNLNKANVSVISRDKIRFAILDANNSKDYFAYEDDVFKSFVDLICGAINTPHITDVVADATHLTASSRRKLIRAISARTTDFKVGFILMLVDFDICAKRNNKRKGREKVPFKVMVNMAGKTKFPRDEECAEYDVFGIINVDDHDAAYYTYEGE